MERPRIDKYHLLKSIGKGGMAEVYLAINPGVGGLGKFVALKKIRREFNLDPKRSKLFRREAEVAIKLNHPNICSIYEVGEHDGSLYLVMEFLPGIDLRNVFEYHQEGLIAIDLPDIIQIIISVAAGLAHAHDFVDPKTGRPTPVIHCDLCPQNIRVNFEGAVKIIDFGIAKVAGQDPNTQTDPIMGKVEYISPEQVQGKKLDGRSDLYSLGIIFWEFLCKKRYFDGEKLPVVQRHLHGEIPHKTLPPELPYAEQLQTIIHKMLAYDINQRYRSAEELEIDLRRFSNKNFPDYFPNKFRDAIQSAFADQIHLHQKIMAKMAASVQPPPPPTQTAPITQPLSRSGSINIKAQAKGTPKVDTLFEAVQILHQPPQKRPSLASLAFPVVAVALLAGLWWIRSPRFPTRVPEVSSVGTNAPTETKDVRSDVPPAGPVDTPVDSERDPSSTDEPKRTAMRITILSKPLGADVWIDGVKMYRRTPASLPVEPNRTYLLKLDKKGHKPYEAYFESQDGTLEIELENNPSAK